MAYTLRRPSAVPNSALGAESGYARRWIHKAQLKLHLAAVEKIDRLQRAEDAVFVDGADGGHGTGLSPFSVRTRGWFDVAIFARICHAGVDRFQF